MIGTLLTTAGADLQAEISDALAVAIPVAIVILGAVIGWRLFKKFARG